MGSARSVLAAILLAAAGASPAPALGSSCNREIVVPIRFPAGSTTWLHRGPGTHYVGFFSKGQSLSIAGAGGVKYDVRGDLSWATASQDPWLFTIEGPGGFLKSAAFDHQGVLYIDRLPATGKYVISMGPCADWGEPGTVVIHASDPRLTIK
jgi:hypothetical protein